MLNDFFAEICYRITLIFNFYVDMHIMVFEGVIIGIFKVKQFTLVSFGAFLILLLWALALLSVDLIIIFFIWLKISSSFLNLRIKLKRRFLTDAISNQYVVGTVVNKELKRNIRLTKSYLVTIKYTKLDFDPEFNPEFDHRLETDPEFDPEYEIGALKETFDNQDLFSKYEISDKVSVILVEHWDKDSCLIDRTLELPE